MAFVEHNNRDIAKKHAEFITGEKLRRYVSQKVEKYLGKGEITVFDGAVGSGQLEQFLNVSKLYGCDVQEAAIETCRINFPNADLTVGSFFQMENNIECDAVVMNMPFSIRFSTLSKEDQTKIKEEFPWKKSGLVDDIFILKSLNFTKRYAFHICFPGISYRTPEQKLRDLLGNMVAEINIIDNAFEDTTIQVLFLVIDKEKTSDTVHQELYDCKAAEPLLITMEGKLEKGERWEQARIEKEREKVDIKAVEKKIVEDILLHIDRQIKLEIYTGVLGMVHRDHTALDTINKVRKVCDDNEILYRETQTVADFLRGTRYV